MTNHTPDDRDQRLKAFQENYGLEELDVGDLNHALTHRSYAYEVGVGEDNERLEFLGDALIAAMTAEWLFEADSQADEGTLSKRRSRLVSRVALGRHALQMGLDGLILLGRGERDTGGARRRSTLGSALEALVGIVYLRLGFEAARKLIRIHLLAPMLEQSTHLTHEDFKSLLQEWAQQYHKVLPAYTLLQEEGPAHERRFTVEVSVAGQALARASGQRIKQAENEAARLGLQKIKE